LKLRPKHYWHYSVRRASPGRFAAAVCDAARTIAMLSLAPQKALSLFDRVIAFLTTPFKFLGISGWKETGCEAEAAGRPVRGAQHSTDGFWTIDVALAALAIGPTPADLTRPRYVRIEVEPETAAHAVCASNAITPSTDLAFGGPVVIDTDGPFLEVHPDANFQLLR